MLFNGDWGHWELGHKVTFDPALRHIIANPGVTNLDIKIDVYSAWKEWVSVGQNSAYPSAARADGGAPIPGGFTGATFFLINEWKLLVNLTEVRINGVLFSDDFDTAYFDSVTAEPVYPATVSSLVNQTVTVQNVVTGDVNAIPANVWNYVLSPMPPTGSGDELVQRIHALAQAILGLSA